MENEMILHWFQFADMDLAAAEYLQKMYPLPLEIICARNLTVNLMIC